MGDKVQIRGDQNASGALGGTINWVKDLKRGRRPGPSLGGERLEPVGPSTTAVHAGTIYDQTTGAVGTPIYQNTTFLFNQEQYRAFDEGYPRDRFIYSRYGNPSQWAVQEKLAALEGAESSLVFSSGMAAITTTLMALVDRGGHVVASQELYGGTYNLLNQELPNMGMSATLVNPRDLKAIEAAIRPNTQVLYFEALTNPLLRVVDLEGLVNIAKRHHLRVVVDATFMTPMVVKPLEYGVDVVVHSATKYLNGHSDLTAGVASASRKLVDQIWTRMINYGGCLDPHGCFLLERGLKTLAVRMKAHSENSLELAAWLEKHPKIKRVYHPLLCSHPDRVLARNMMEQAPGMVAFMVKGGNEAALKLMDMVKIPKQATSLGGVETLISMPFNSSHSSYTAKQMEILGIDPGCIRLSVGIEDVGDLIADFDAGLKKI